MPGLGKRVQGSSSAFGAKLECQGMGREGEDGSAREP